MMNPGAWVALWFCLGPFLLFHSAYFLSARIQLSAYDGTCPGKRSPPSGIPQLRDLPPNPLGLVPVRALFDFMIGIADDPPMIQITEAAAKHLKELALEKGATGLRISVEKGGCAGLQYAMSIGSPEEGDSISERDGAIVAVDQESLSHLAECTLDYADDLTGTGFRIINPKAARSCGCGTSFEPSPEKGS